MLKARADIAQTTQGVAMQLPSGRPLRLITSTMVELEQLMPMLLNAIASGRTIDVLHGIPFCKSTLNHIMNLNQTLVAAMSKENRKGVCPISFLVDNPSHLDMLAGLDGESSRRAIGVFIKIDTGYKRAGVVGDSETLQVILNRLSETDRVIKLLGLYTHLGQSYGFSAPEENVAGLMTEIRSLSDIVSGASQSFAGSEPIILSVGATPTATAAQNLVTTQVDNPAVKEWQSLQEQLRRQNCELELHAGVYPFLDLQQVATGARPSNHNNASMKIRATLSVRDIGIRILAEVASVYSERSKKEALIAAGVLALGREPCKSYPGWGIVTPWRPGKGENEDIAGSEGRYFDPSGDRTGWIVGRVSQEHGILSYESEDASKEVNRDFSIGDKVLIWPNHACITAAAYGWYFVVDSESDNPDIVRDIWVRWRGW